MAAKDAVAPHLAPAPAVPQALLVPHIAVPRGRDAVLEGSIASVPKVMQERAKRALDVLQNNPAVTFDNDNRLVLHGKPVEGSNFQDLIHALFSRNLRKLPNHSDVFARELHSINFPTSYVSNPRIRDLMNSREPSPISFHLFDEPPESQSGRGRAKYAAHASLIKRRKPSRKSKRIMRLYH